MHTRGIIAVDRHAPGVQHQMTVPGDAAASAARALFLVGLFLSPLTVLRVSGFTLGDAALLASLPFALVARAQSPRSYYPSAFAIAATLLVAVGGLMATLHAFDATDSLLVVVRLLIVAAVIPWEAKLLLDSDDRLQRGVVALALGAGLCGFGTVLQAVGGPNTIPGTEPTTAGRYTGFAQHVSDTGGITAIGLALGLGVFIGAAGRIARTLGAVSALGSAVGLVLSGSVAGMIAAAVGVFVYVLTKRVRPRFWVPIATVGAVGAWLASSLQDQTANALDPVERFLQVLGLSAGGAYNTADSRLATYQSAFESILSSPLVGAGFDPTSTLADGRFPPHNLFIAALFSGGLLVLIGLAMFILRPLLGRSPNRSTVGIATKSAAWTAFVFAMTAPSIFNRYFWLPIALLVAARVFTKTPPATRAKSEPKRASEFVRSSFR